MNKHHPKRQEIRQAIAKIICELRPTEKLLRPTRFQTVDQLIVNEDLFDPNLFTSWVDIQSEDKANYYQVRIDHEACEYGGFDYFFQLQKLVPVSDEDWLRELIELRFPTASQQQRVYAITGAWLTDDQIDQLRGVL